MNVSGRDHRDPLVLVWGLPDDGPTEAVLAGLRGLDVHYVMIDQRDVASASVEVEVEEMVRGVLRAGPISVDLSQVTGAYIRPHDSRRIAAVEGAGEGSALWNHALAVDDSLVMWSELADAQVANRPSAMASNNSKPYQAGLIRQAGFATPETLVTNDPAAAEWFCRSVGSAVYKSVSGIRSIVTRVEDAELARLDDVSWCPTQFQEFVPGVDYRVHVVGDALFACRVESDAVDYRYAARFGHDLEIVEAPLPEHVAMRCTELARGLGLWVSGIDLRVTSEGVWYCFEVNPSPGFTFYEDRTGQPIARAIAEFLASGS